MWERASAPNKKNKYPEKAIAMNTNCNFDMVPANKCEFCEAVQIFTAFTPQFFGPIVIGQFWNGEIDP